MSEHIIDKMAYGGNIYKFQDNVSNYATVDMLAQLDGALVFKGTIGPNNSTVSSLPNPHSVGDIYRVNTAGNYFNGTDIAAYYTEVGDLIICIADGTTTNNADWTVAQNNIINNVFYNSFSKNGLLQASDNVGGTNTINPKTLLDNYLSNGTAGNFYIGLEEDGSKISVNIGKPSTAGTADRALKGPTPTTSGNFITWADDDGSFNTAGVAVIPVNKGGTGQTSLSQNAILLGNNTDGIQASSLTISGTTIDSASDLEIDSSDILNLYGLNEAHLFTDNNNIDLTSSGITINDDATINISTPQGGNNLINLTSTIFNINAALTKLPGNYYFGYDSLYRQGEIIIESQGTGDAMLALKAGDSGHYSYIDISDQSSGIVISTINSGYDITIQSYDKININGKMILTEDINYGSSLPQTGTTGQIFFKYVT